MLAWQGQISALSRESLEETLSRNLPDILDAIQSGDSAGVAWSFSEVASELANAKIRAKRRQRELRILLGVYITFVLATSIGFFIWWITSVNSYTYLLPQNTPATWHGAISHQSYSGLRKFSGRLCVVRHRDHIG